MVARQTKKVEEYVDETYKEADAVEEKSVDVEKKSSHAEYLDKVHKAKEYSEKAKEEMRKGNYELLRNDCYQKFDVVVDMVKEGIAVGGLIYGRGGTGKSTRTKQLLSDVDYEVIMTKVTTKTLFILFYEYRDCDVIVFEDVKDMTKDSAKLSLLKAFFEDIRYPRSLQYNTTQPIKTEDGEIVPSNFVIKARGLILSNEIPNEKNDDVSAVLSRIKVCHLTIPRPELINMFHDIAKKPYGDLTLEEREEVLDYLVINTSEDNKSLNLRTYFNAMDYRRHSKLKNLGDQWKINLNDDLKKDVNLVILANILKDPNFYNEPERRAKFDELIHGTVSKSTYNRMKKELVENGLKCAPYKEREESSSEDEESSTDNSTSEVLPEVPYQDE